MNFFNKDEVVTGTKTNSIIAFIASIVALIVPIVGLLLSNSLLFLSIGAWIISIFQVRKGLVSEDPKFAKIARILIVLGAVVIVVSSVAFGFKTIQDIF